jgi:hypothetical protein
VFILASILLSGTAASAAVETLQLQWASYDFYTKPTWTNATTTVSLEPWIAPDGSGTGYHLYGPTGAHSNQFGDQFDLYFRCGSGNPQPCAVASNFSFPYDGSLMVERDYPAPGDAYITLDITWSGHVSGRLIGVGTKQQPPPPSTVKVFITQPRNGDTVSGTVWVVLWAEDTSGASNTFTLSADGRQIGSETTSSRGPVTIPWPTTGGTPVPNGTHTLTGTVRDATGNTGTTSITVIVKN